MAWESVRNPHLVWEPAKTQLKVWEPWTRNPYMAWEPARNPTLAQHGGPVGEER